MAEATVAAPPLRNSAVWGVLRVYGVYVAPKLPGEAISNGGSIARLKLPSPPLGSKQVRFVAPPPGFEDRFDGNGTPREGDSASESEPELETPPSEVHQALITIEPPTPVVARLSPKPVIPVDALGLGLDAKQHLQLP